MGMQVGTAGGDDEVVSAINTTPLVDVMLVLLIIFLITIPVVNKSVPVELPKEPNPSHKLEPGSVNVAVKRDGAIFWDDRPLAGQEALVAELKRVAVQFPQPQVQIRGDAQARYEHVGQVVHAAQRAGIVKLGFVTERPPLQ